MFTRVSFSVESSCKSGEKHKIGGLTLATVKKENGARFTFPEASTVETQAIGRGNTVPIRILYISWFDLPSGFISIFSYPPENMTVELSGPKRVDLRTSSKPPFGPSLSAVRRVDELTSSRSRPNCSRPRAAELLVDRSCRIVGCYPILYSAADSVFLPRAGRMDAMIFFASARNQMTVQEQICRGRSREHRAGSSPHEVRCPEYRQHRPLRAPALRSHQ